MREQLISLLVSKLGLDQQKADQAVDVILEYIKDNPQQFTSHLENLGLGGIAGKLGGSFNK